MVEGRCAISNTDGVQVDRAGAIVRITIDRPPGFDAALQRENAGQRELFDTGEFTELLTALLARRASARFGSDRQHGRDAAGAGRKE